jgi:hypothetical protein
MIGGDFTMAAGVIVDADYAFMHPGDLQLFHIVTQE